MKTNNIQEIKELIENTDVHNLLISAHAVAHSYDHDNLDENDIYNLMRDVLSVVTSIEVIKEII